MKRPSGSNNFTTSSCMARRGVWQLSKLRLSYCEHSGSSRGVRDFVKEHLLAFQETNTQLSIEAKSWPGRHPYFRGEYRNGNVRAVGLRNAAADQVLQQATLLRNSAGRKTSLKVKHRKVFPKEKGDASQYVSPSVQGGWTAAPINSLYTKYT